MTLYQKILSVYGMIRSMLSVRALRSELAVNFNASANYAVGRLVVYEDTLYRCTQTHSGAWNPAHFVVTTIDEALATKGGSAGITGVQLNGTDLTPTQGVVNVEALTGVQVNGSTVTPSSGVANVQAITGVKVNGTPISPENGVANVQAITGVKVNGTSMTPENGVVNIPSSSAWILDNVSDGGPLSKDTCNIYDVLTYGGSPTLYLASPATNECRQFALCIRNHSGSWNGTIIDNHTGVSLAVVYYPSWSQTTLDALISEKMASGGYSSSIICVRLYEIYRGMFTVMDIY